MSEAGVVTTAVESTTSNNDSDGPGKELSKETGQASATPEKEEERRVLVQEELIETTETGEESVTSLDVSCLVVEKDKTANNDKGTDSPLPVETTRPPNSQRAWASSSSENNNNNNDKSQKSLRTIMQEQEKTRATEEEEAAQIAAAEQEEELVKLALERSLSDMRTHSQHAATPTTSRMDSRRSLNYSGSCRSLGSEQFALKVQEEVETTEGFVDSPHSRSNRRILIKPSNSQHSLMDNNGSQRSLVSLSPTAASASASASASSPNNNNNRAAATAQLDDNVLSEYGLDDASEHLSPEELNQIAQALRDSEIKSSPAQKEKSGITASSREEYDKKPSAAGAGGGGCCSSSQQRQHSQSSISVAESQAIEKALREADEEAERKSVQLALRMLQEDDQQLKRSSRAASRHHHHHALQGNVRTMTRAELEAERNFTPRVGAFRRNSPPRTRHPLDEDDHVAAGFRMNSNTRHEWSRRDQNHIVGPNNEIRTKHDASLQGMANAQRLGLDPEDSLEGTIVGNKAYNSFMQSVRRNKKGVAAHGTGRAGSEVDGTKAGSMDPSTRLEISRAINNGLIERLNGVVKEGKEAVIYHADRGRESEGFDVAVKVFKRIQEFRARGDYVDGDPRYAKSSFRSVGPRDQLALWTEKEFRNLVRAHRAGVPVPTPLHFRENVLFMRFLGSDGWPAPQLRELNLRRGSRRWTTLYDQTMCAIRT